MGFLETHWIFSKKYTGPLGTGHWAILGQRHLKPGFTMVHERIKKKMFESKMLLDDRYR
jgi:hypothetical protein